MQGLVTAILLIAAGWLAFAGLVMAIRPHMAKAALAAMGSNAAIHLGEHALRALVGLSMIIRAPESQCAPCFYWSGWFILASSIAIALAPRRWHHAYAGWWANRIPLRAYRLLAPISLIAAMALAYGAW